MPDFHLTDAFLKGFPRTLLRIIKPLVLLFVLVVPVAFPLAAEPASAPGSAQEQNDNIPPINLPNDLFGREWRAQVNPRILTADQFAVVQGGEVFLEYGLQRVVMRTYARGSEGMTVEVFEMKYPTGAYGLLTFNRQGLPSHRRELQFGRYLVSLSMQNPASVVSEEAIAAVKSIFPPENSSNTAPLVSHLPSPDRVASSEIYIIGKEALKHIEGFARFSEFVDFSGGVEIALADYPTAGGTKLIIVEYHTPQSASSGYDSAYNQMKALPESEQDRRVLKRVGNYVVQANLTGNSAAEIAAGRKLVDQVKYQMVVYWEGSKFTSIPIQFRPPDPAALEEFRETTRVLLRTFYGIGLMLLSSIVIGVFAGWAIFYWRRQRRRKLGMDDYFSDAGETVRLNLDDYLFQPKEQSIKLLGKGDA